jgi:ABC-type transport system involved in multi-copper enzyme maturation permease subunit
MTESFPRLFAFWLVLWLVQTVAALPWLAALDPRALVALRRPKFLGIVVVANLLAAFLAATTIANNPDLLMHWGRGYLAGLHVQLAADFFVAVFAVMLRVWPKGGAVALAAFREAVRQPMFLLLALPTIFFAMPIIPLLPYFTLGEDIKMVKELGYDLLVMLGSIFVVICASTSISDEIEGRTAVTLMSKPISRRQFLLGKFAGTFLAGTVLVVLLGWFMVWMFIFKESSDPQVVQSQRRDDPAWVLDVSSRYAPEGPPYDVVRGMCLWIEEAGAVFPGLVIVSCQMMVLLAIAVALATRLHFTITFIVCAGFYFLGHLAPVLTAVSYNKMPLVKFTAGVFDVFMPGLEHFDMSGAVVRDIPLPPWEFALYTVNVALYAVTYSVIALLFGLILFEDKDLA